MESNIPSQPSRDFGAQLSTRKSKAAPNILKESESELDTVLNVLGM